MLAEGKWQEGFSFGKVFEQKSALGWSRGQNFSRGNTSVNATGRSEVVLLTEQQEG